MKRLLLYTVMLTLFACSSCDVYEHSDKRLKALEQQEQTEEVVQQEAYHKMTKDWIMMLYCCLIIVGVGAIVCYLLFAWHSAKMGKEINDERRERTRLQEDYEQQLAHISERIKNKEKSLTMMSDYIYNHLSVASKLVGIDEHTRTIKMTDKDWLELEVYLNTTHSCFVEQFKSRHPEASLDVLRFCMLLRLELSNRQIATVYHIAEKSIKQKAYLYKEQLANIPANMSLRAYVTSLI